MLVLGGHPCYSISVRHSYFNYLQLSPKPTSIIEREHINGILIISFKTFFHVFIFRLLSASANYFNTENFLIYGMYD